MPLTRSRFHQEVKDTLEKRRADVIELAQHLTDNMNDIHGAIVQCMNSTLTELRRSKVDVRLWNAFFLPKLTSSKLELDSLNLPAAYFSSFDHLVRKQLDPIWHKVGPATKALVRDIGVLRRLVNYLLVYDPLQFHSYCQSLIEAAIAPATASSSAGSGKSQWMLTDAANIIFQAAKARCFVDVPPNNQTAPSMTGIEDEDEEGWDAVYQSEGRAAPSNKTGKRPQWIPKEMEPVLEELPKWSLLSEILEEIEIEIVRMESTVFSRPVEEPPGTNITLVMCSSTATCTLLNDFLSLKDDKRPKGEWGRRMMLKKLRSWLWWEKRRKELIEAEASGKKGASGHDPDEMRWRGENPEDEGLSEALKRKDRERAAQKASRRRVRGGGPGPSDGRASTVPRDTLAPGKIPQLNFEDLDPELLALNDEELELNLIGNDPDMLTTEFTAEFDAHYGLLSPAQTLLIRAYSDDTDDRMLDEIKPRFIVMFEPCMEFVRRVEVCECISASFFIRVDLLG